MKIGDLVKVKDGVNERKKSEIQIDGMIGAISPKKYWIFNNEYNGNKPGGIKPEDFNYKYSWAILKCNIPDKSIITLLSIDDYNKKELKKV